MLLVALKKQSITLRTTQEVKFSEVESGINVWISGDRNWEKGIPVSRYVSAILRHTFKYIWGANDEDHLAAIAWNAFAIMHHEVEHPEMQDLPGWEGRTSKWIFKGLDKGDTDE
jgi:hypothetical protein